MLRLFSTIDGREVGEFKAVHFGDLIQVVRADVWRQNAECGEVWTEDGKLLWAVGINLWEADKIACYKPNGEPVFAISGGASPKARIVTEIFTAIDTTWTNPGAGVARTFVRGAGSGGGGGGTLGGGGGAAGANYAETNPLVLAAGAAALHIHVGAPGTGGTGGNAGNSGDKAWISTTSVAPTSTAQGCLADAVFAGNPGGATGGGGGTGGLFSSIGDIKHRGGDGASGTTSVNGGGGGGAGDANDGSNATANPGGAGGAAGGGTGGNGGSGAGAGANGAAFGGGGGGGGPSITTPGKGGDGTTGQAQLIYTLTTIAPAFVGAAIKRASFF